jgi:hypothetical protein
MARAVLAGLFTQEEAEAVVDLVEFHQGAEDDIPNHLKEPFVFLMGNNAGFTQTLKARFSTQHALCTCGHGQLVHFGKCEVPGCNCPKFEAQPS